MQSTQDADHFLMRFSYLVKAQSYVRMMH